MGSDDLFHKKRQREAVSLQRAKAKKAPYDRVLIVCEGSKTEPYYFQELIDAFKLNTANIKVAGRECGSAPKDVVEYAIRISSAQKDFDRVYCVFDKDRHTTYQEALNRIHQTKLGQGRLFVAITSVPCFEFWLLLHFEYTTRQFGARGPGASICAEVIELLHRYLPEYGKGMRNVFRQLEERLAQAMENAGRVREYNRSGGTDHPSTQMDELVRYFTTPELGRLCHETNS